MGARIQPRGDAAAAAIDVKHCDVEADESATPHSDCLAQWGVSTTFIVCLLASCLLCVVSSALMLGLVDVSTATHTGRTALFLAFYAGAWTVLIRIGLWLNRT